MDALDLTKAPPRSPNVRLGGLYFLARTIDKLRATLPGGNLGRYYIRGFSSSLLEMLGVEERELRAEVAKAKSDDEVVAWLREHTDPSMYDEINEKLSKRNIAGRINDEDFLQKYPFAANLPREMRLFDMLDLDDRALFAKG